MSVVSRKNIAEGRSCSERVERYGRGGKDLRGRRAVILVRF